MWWILEITNNAGALSTFHLLEARIYTFGRLDTNDITVYHDSKVSRHHATLKVEKVPDSNNAQCHLIDHSKFGTFVNGQRLNKNISTNLKDGDRIEFGGMMDDDQTRKSPIKSIKGKIEDLDEDKADRKMDPNQLALIVPESQRLAPSLVLVVRHTAPYVLCLSGFTKSQYQSLEEQLKKVMIHVFLTAQEATHIVTKQAQLTDTMLMGLVLQRPIVTESFLLELSNRPGLTTPLPDPNLHLLPSSRSRTTKMDGKRLTAEMCKINSKRCQLFQGHLFVLCQSPLHQRVSPILIQAGGEIEQVDVKALVQKPLYGSDWRLALREAHWVHPTKRAAHLDPYSRIKRDDKSGPTNGEDQVNDYQTMIDYLEQDLTFQWTYFSNIAISIIQADASSRYLQHAFPIRDQKRKDVDEWPKSLLSSSCKADHDKTKYSEQKPELLPASSSKRSKQLNKTNVNTE